MKKCIFLTLISFLCQLCNGQQWFPIGPAPQNSNQPNKVSGRVLAIAFTPRHSLNGIIKPAAMFIGIDGGGIWRSTDYQNASPDWVPLTDNLGVQNIYSIAVSPTNPNILYAGGNNGNLLFSSDGGDNWYVIQTGAAGDYRGNIIKVLIHPATGDVYFATRYTNNSSGGYTQGGIYKKTAAGITQINNGLPDIITIISDMDYAVDQAGGITFFAANQVNSGGSNPDDFGIWSYTENTGQWINVNSAINYFDIGTGQVTDKNSLGGTIRFAANHSPGSPAGLYAAITNKISGNLMNVFHLSSGTWQPVGNTISGLLSTHACLDFGFSESGALYVGLGNDQQQTVYQSTDKGMDWFSVFNGTGNPAITPHVDQRSFGFNEGKVYLGNDGGIYRFNPLANNQGGSSNWESLNNSSLQTILVQGAGIDPSNQNHVLCGSQDNSVGLLVNGQWIDASITSGDNGRISFDPDPANNGQFAYAASVSDFVFFFRSDDGGRTWSDRSPPDAKAQHAYVGDYAPFAIDPQNTSRITVGIDRIYESMDRGNNWGPAKSPVFITGTSCDAIMYDNADNIWVAYQNKLYETVNDGGDGSTINWTEKSGGTDFTGTIVKIAVDPRFNENVYLATKNGKIWERMFFNRTATWKNISANLPVVIINTLAVVPTQGANPPMLFVGTDRGVFASFDNGNSWQAYNFNLPTDNITDLQFTGNPGAMIAGLYGRGIFKTYFPPLTDAAPSLAGVGNNLYFFEKSLDGRIFYNTAVLGQAGLGWRQINGNLRTNTAPAAGVIGNHVYVVIKSTGGGLYLNQADLGGNFGDWLPMNFQTDAAPAVVGAGNNIYFFAKSTDGRIFYNHAIAGQGGSGWVEVDGAGITDAAPAAGSVGNHIFLMIKSPGGNILLNQADAGGHFGSWSSMNFATNVAPAVTGVGQNIYFFATSTAGKIFYNHALLGQGGSGWKEMDGNGLTDNSPAACAVGNNYMFVAIKGNGNDYIFLNQADQGQPFGNWFISN